MIRNEPEVCAPERSRFLSKAGASGSHHLPWALPRVLHAKTKIKRVRGSKHDAGRGPGVVCSRDVSSAFTLDRRANDIAAHRAERRRGSGPAGRPNSDTEPPPLVRRNGTTKTGATASGLKAETARITSG